MESLTPAGAPWIYFKLYVGTRTDRVDYLITDVIPEALAEGGHECWFFLRYTDEGGPHLRLRLRPRDGCEARLRDDIGRRIRPLVAALPTVAPSGYRPLIPLAEGGATFAGRAPSAGRVEMDEYQPETVKFGKKGMPVAERLFEASSALVLKILREERDDRISRKTLVPLLMNDTLKAFPTPVADERFWRDYGLFWLGGENADTVAWRGRFFAKAKALAAGDVSILPDAEELGAIERSCVLEWRRALAEARSAYDRMEDGVIREGLAFQFMHLTNNRLGLSPIEESYCAALLESLKTSEARS